MAVLSKIRERSLFLILIIGMALFAFVASPKDIMNFFQSNKTGLVGTVNGEGVSQEEFTNQIKNLKSRNPNIKDGDASKQVWDGLISEKIYAAQLEKAGIVVGEKDIWDNMVNSSAFKNDPQFQNELGMFDEEALKAYIDDLRENKDLDAGSKQQWAGWLAFENQTKRNLEQEAYLNMITIGVGSSLIEGKQEYFANNTTVKGSYVLLPYTSIADSTITVTDADVKSYIEKHKSEYQVKASRSIQYVKFDLAATDADKTAMKNDLTSLVSELKSTDGENLQIFVDENTDIEKAEKYEEKTALNKNVSDALFGLNIGDVFGPYEDKGYFKVSKFVSEKAMNSVKASHILVAYKDSTNSKPEITRTKEEAKSRAKKLLRKVRNYDIEKFAEEAKVSSDGPSGPRGGALGTFKEGRMVPAFNDWIFSHKKGDIGMVETQFGFHVMMIEDTFTGREFATISKLIEASPTTESTVFENAASFENNIKGKDFMELAKEKNYKIMNGQKLTKNGDVIPGLTGNNTQIVNWTFEEGVEIGSTKRFDIEGAYIVARVTEMEAKGLQSVKGATAKAKSFIINNKKAAILAKKMESGTLDEIADRENTKKLVTRELNFNMPVTSTLGRNKVVVGALLGMKEGETVRGVQGLNGVYALELTSKEVPAELSTYEPYLQQVNQKLKKDKNKIFEALKETANIENYR